MENSPPTPLNPEADQHDAAKTALRLANIEALRAKQKELYDPHYSQGDGIDDEEALNKEIDESIDAYLKQQGVDETHPLHEQVRRSLAEFSYLNISNTTWQYGEWKDEEDHALGLEPNSRGKERVILCQRALFGDSLEEVSVDDTAPEGDEEKHETSAEKLTKAREAKQQAYVAKLRGPVFLRPGQRGELQAAYETALQEYETALDEVSKEEIALWVEAGKDRSEIEKLIAENTNKRLYEDVEAQRQLLIKESGWVGKFLDRYANYGRLKKLGVTIGLGAVGLGVGFGAGLLAGAAGSAILGLGLAGGVSAASMKALGAVRIYKLRQADLFKKQDDLPQFSLSELGDGTNTPTTEGVRRLSLDFLRNQAREQLERGEKIKRRAVYWTLGSVAVGGAAGTLMHGVWAGEGAGTHWQGGWLQHWTEQAQNHTGPGSPTGPDLDNPNLGGNGGKIEPPVNPEPQPPSKDEIIRDYIAEHGAAGKISRGEGWFQTFKELGISAEDRRSFLNEYGDDLLKKFPKVTYRMPNGEPGILMTKDGKMPSEVLKYIVEHANKEGYLKNPLDFSDVQGGGGNTVVEATGVRQPGLADFEPAGNSGASVEAADKLINTHELVAANTVSNGESMTRTLNELKKAGVIDIPADEYGKLLKDVGPQLARIEYSNGTPVAYPNRFPPYDWRLNRSPSGRLHAKAIRLIERVARERAYAKAA